MERNDGESVANGSVLRESLISKLLTLCNPNLSTPRHYVVRDYPEAGLRTAQEQYSYAYTNTSSSSSSSSRDPYSRRPQTTSYTQESVMKRESGPYGSYSTERSSRTSTGGGPGGYHSSYETHTSGRLPGGTTYRHFSYRV